MAMSGDSGFAVPSERPPRRADVARVASMMANKFGNRVQWNNGVDGNGDDDVVAGFELLLQLVRAAFNEMAKELKEARKASPEKESPAYKTVLGEVGQEVTSSSSSHRVLVPETMPLKTEEEEDQATMVKVVPETSAFIEQELDAADDDEESPALFAKKKKKRKKPRPEEEEDSPSVLDRKAGRAKKLKELKEASDDDDFIDATVVSKGGKGKAGGSSSAPASTSRASKKANKSPEKRQQLCSAPPPKRNKQVQPATNRFGLETGRASPGMLRKQAKMKQSTIHFGSGSSK